MPPTSTIVGFESDIIFLSVKPQVINDVLFEIRDINNFIPGIYSYKHHCKEVIPEDASIIVFHGHPRPHEVKEIWQR